MPIPSDVLQKWAKPGKNEMSKQTYAALRELLLGKLNNPQPNIYLQGSYRNSTNVKDNSDIDIVVEYDSNIDVTRLKDYIYGRINNAHNFHFTTGAKTVKYKGLRNQYVPADIVPCVSVKGKTGCVAIYDSSRKTIIHNYPKIHI
jgi:tRNA nucleotidyltransferase (CCA-adding enzyme)